jgi:hypothetical protein
MEKTDWLHEKADDGQPFEYQTPVEMVKAGKFVTIAAPMVRYSKYVVLIIQATDGI